MTSVAEKVQNSAGPIDRLAARVIKKAKPEDVWMPKPKPADHITRSENMLPTAPIPRNARHMAEFIGRRRGRLTIVGYAKDQGKRTQKAKWVVRCDCGNYEHRSNIVRWVGTDAPDVCTECRVRIHRTTKGFWSSDKAERKTLAALSADALLKPSERKPHTKGTA